MRPRSACHASESWSARWPCYAIRPTPRWHSRSTHWRSRSTGPRPRATERSELDDSAQPLATIALDGRFESINPAFESLVGYTEADFRHARWPSLADREKLAEHRALLARLATGELESARVETVYMHGQGLTVPVKGKLELVRTEGGAPRHLQLSVDHD